MNPRLFWKNFLLLLWLLRWTESFLVSRPSRSHHHHDRYRHITLKGSQDEDADANDDSVMIQQMLMKRGMKWPQCTITKNMTKVPGCVSTVHVQASTDDVTGHVQLTGHSDAIVSRGILAVLEDYLSYRTVDEVLQLHSDEIADTLGLRSALTKGRMDGVGNMLNIVQQQLRGEPTIALVDGRRGSVTSSLSSSPSPSSPGKPTVALLLSGGVDSSVALRLLQEDGYDVTAFYLKIWLEDELAHLGECPWEDDVHMCQRVCEQAGISLEILSLQVEYHEKVMQHTLREVAQGRTPNPDILCNSRVKFGCFLEYLEGQSFDFVASGHYAQLKRDNDDDVLVRLYRAPDPIKDQSIFLCALNQTQLQKILFPIGHLEKSRVRQLADEFDLPNRKRPDSQGLCFLGKVKFSDFLKVNLGESPGDIIDAFTGEVIGRHRGVWYHTVGQRKGIGNSLHPLETAKGPWYVVAKDPMRRIVYASNRYDEEAFTQARSQFHVENIHWITNQKPDELLQEDGTYRLWLKIRHGPRLVQGNLKVLSANKEEEDGSEEGHVILDMKDGGLAPGQYAVFYNEEAECLGGGIISERHWAEFLLKNSRSLDNVTS